MSNLNTGRSRTIEILFSTTQAGDVIGRRVYVDGLWEVSPLPGGAPGAVVGAKGNKATVYMGYAVLAESEELRKDDRTN